MASQKLGLDELQIVFSIKVNLLYLLYSTTFMSVFPKWDRLVGHLDKMAKNCLKITKSTFLRQIDVGDMGDMSISWVVGVPPPLWP